METNDINKKKSLILAIKNAAYTNSNFNLPRYVLDFIIKCTNSSDTNLAYLGILTSIILYDFDKNGFRYVLCTYITKSNQCKINICEILRYNDISDIEFEIYLLTECSNSYDTLVIDWASQITAEKIYTQIIKKQEVRKSKWQHAALEMLMRWSKRKYFQSISRASLLHSIGEADIDYAWDFVLNYMDDLNQVNAQFIYSKILSGIFNLQKCKLVKNLSMLSQNGRFHYLVLFSFKEMLNDIRHKYGMKLARYNSVVSRILNFAKSGVNTSSIHESKYVDSLVTDILKVIKLVDSLQTDDDKSSKSIKNVQKQLVDLQDEINDEYYAALEIVNVLNSLSKDKNIDAWRLTREFRDLKLKTIVIQSLMLIEAMCNTLELLDYNNARRTFQSFPQISLFLGNNWLEEKCKEIFPYHPLLLWLSKVWTKPRFNKLVEDYCQETNVSKKEALKLTVIEQIRYSTLLNHTENCLEFFSSRTSPGTKRIVDGLQREEDFHQTMSQLEMASLLSKKYHVELESRSFGKPIDIIATRDNVNLLLEVTSLDMIAPLKYGGFEPDVKNKAREVTLKKLKQINGYVKKSEYPVILVIDKSRALDIDILDIIDTLEGRTNDAIGFFEGGNRLTAIILYNIEISYEEQSVKLKGSVNLNKLADVKLDKTIEVELITMLQ